ncbi:putative dehydrogenase [Planctomycetales bacterium 10988]|nr:putative dehydrogenase [Planctomycetales bacterium 10988]
MKNPRPTTRRTFLKQSAAVAGLSQAPYFVSSSVFAKPNRPAPSDRITVGCIGLGGKGRRNMTEFAKEPDSEVVALCDLDQAHLKLAQETLAGVKGSPTVSKVTRDFREIVSDSGIDAVSIATPDHWHALTTIAAAKAGKDIYCEKPLANSVMEGRAMCEAAQQHKVVLQTGSHERSRSTIRYACELALNGYLGEIHTIRIQMPTDQAHHMQARELVSMPKKQEVPEGFDYDMWLGHTAEVPYYEERCHFWWRFQLAYGGGEMTDRGAHILDIAQMALGKDRSGPVRFEAKGTRNESGLYDAFMDFQFVNTYDNGVKVVGDNSGPRGLELIGSDGKIFIAIHGGKLTADPVSLLDINLAKEDYILGRSPGHFRNFLDCVKSREEPVATGEFGHRTSTICHLNNIAMITGRTLEWDPEREVVLNDPEANGMLLPKMRHPWSI